MRKRCKRAPMRTRRPDSFIRKHKRRLANNSSHHFQQRHLKRSVIDLVESKSFKLTKPEPQYIPDGDEEQNITYIYRPFIFSREMLKDFMQM